MSEHEFSGFLKGLQWLVAIALLSGLLVGGAIVGSFYWHAYVAKEPSKTWNGCVAPADEAERAEWAARAEARGETLCEPGFLEDE